jgi:hypothetical protein
VFHSFFNTFILNYHPIPRRDSISRPIAPVSSVAGGDDTRRLRRPGQSIQLLWLPISTFDSLRNRRIFSLFRSCPGQRGHFPKSQKFFSGVSKLKVFCVKVKWGLRSAVAMERQSVSIVTWQPLGFHAYQSDLGFSLSLSLSVLSFSFSSSLFNTPSASFMYGTISTNSVSNTFY